MKRRLAGFLCCLIALHIGGVAVAGPGTPVVYEDDYVVIRAAVPDVGRKAIHIGDELTLEIGVEFDHRAVRIESLDADYFLRNFADQAAITLSGAITQDKSETSWSFQILDCPVDQVVCPGEKVYELPIFTLSYQIIGQGGRLLNDKTVHFRPWPETIPVTPALMSVPPDASGFASAFPAGAYPEPVAVDVRTLAPILLIALAVILLLVSLLGRFSRTHLPFSMQNHPPPAKPWEGLLMALQDDDLDGALWADSLRRCVSGFCVDELSINPYEWLGPADTATSNAIRELDGIRNFFIEVTKHGHVDVGARQGFLAEFVNLVDSTADLKFERHERD